MLDETEVKMIISYQEEIRYWQLLNIAASNFDKNSLTFLAKEFYESLFQKYQKEQNPKERARLGRDLEQLASFEEKSIDGIDYIKKCWEIEKEEDRKEEEGEEWKNN